MYSCYNIILCRNYNRLNVCTYIGILYMTLYIYFFMHAGMYSCMGALLHGIGSEQLFRSLENRIVSKPSI